MAFNMTGKIRKGEATETGGPIKRDMGNNLPGMIPKLLYDKDGSPKGKGSSIKSSIYYK